MQPTSTRLAMLVALLLGALAAVGSPPHADGASGRGGHVAGPCPQPVVLLFHGGGFVEGAASIPDAESAAAAAGFTQVEVDYTLGDAIVALEDARAAARAYAERRCAIVAYGESAGALLAARLAQDGLVAAATGYLCPSNLTTDLIHPVVREMIASMDLTPEELDELAPDQHVPTRSRIYLQVAQDDGLLDTSLQIEWAQSDPGMTYDLVPGTHVFPVTAEQRAAQLTAAMAFIAQALASQPPRGRDATAEPEGTAGAPRARALKKCTHKRDRTRRKCKRRGGRLLP